MNNLCKVIIGTAVGDTIGLPMEGMKPAKIAKLGWCNPLRQRFLFGTGMWSDDTDHTLHLIDALNLSGGDPEQFRKIFSRRLQFWLSTLPPGVGLATLKSIIKQALGFRKTGIFSAGNGPVMRAAALGVFYPESQEQRQLLNAIHTELTHSDPKALEASELIVEIAATFTRGETRFELSKMVKKHSTEWQNLIHAAQSSAQDEVSTEEAMERMKINPKKGVSGYSYHTVPAVIYVGLKNDWDFRQTITEIIALGGDTDSTAAIAGALCALHPRAEIPDAWQSQIKELPVSLKTLRKKCSTSDQATRFINPILWPIYLLRNLIQFAIVIVHIVLRAFPAKLVKLIIK